MNSSDASVPMVRDNPCMPSASRRVSASSSFMVAVPRFLISWMRFVAISYCMVFWIVRIWRLSLSVSSFIVVSFCLLVYLFIVITRVDSRSSLFLPLM